MKYSRILILFTFMLFAFYSCEKKGDLINMYLIETGCYNPWDRDPGVNAGFSTHDPDYENKVKNYLKEKGIKIKAISITNDGPLSGCFACICTTGRKINISIFEIDKNLAEEIGFVSE